MKISIIGSGSGGFAMAAYLASIGHEVCILSRKMQADGSFDLNTRGIIRNNFKIKIIKNNYNELVRYSNLILVITTADAHAKIAKKISKYLTSEKIIILSPGKVFGSLEFYKVINQLSGKKPYVAETNTLLFAAKKIDYNTVEIFGKKDQVCIASYPSKNISFINKITKKIFNQYIPQPSTLHTAVNNIGSILHPPIFLDKSLISSLIKNKSFYLNINDKSEKMILKLDKERIDIAKKLNIYTPSLVNWFESVYGIQPSKNLKNILNNDIYRKIKINNNKVSRYLFEEIPYGLIPLIELGNFLNINMSNMTKICNESKQFLTPSILNPARTFKNLNLKKNELISMIKSND